MTLGWNNKDAFMIMRAIGDDQCTAEEISLKVGYLNSRKVAHQIFRNLHNTHVNVCDKINNKKNPHRTINVYKLTNIGKEWIERYAKFWAEDT